MEIPAKGLLPAELMLGIADIDAQHEAIFYRIENLKASCLDTGELPDHVADDLLAYLAEHFASEETCAGEAGVDFATHHDKHEATLVALRHWVHRVQSGRTDIFSLLRYLEIWFERHILEEDQPFARKILAARPAQPD
jgi:hemerythrin-like metal-binding protein